MPETESLNLSQLKVSTAHTNSLPNPTRRKLSPRKRLVFSVLLGMMTYGILEGVSWFGINWIVGSIAIAQGQLHFQSGTTRNGAFERNSPVEDRRAFPTEVVHPYLGFVQRPDLAAARSGELQFGLATTSPIRRRSKNQVLVAVVGGSVAEFFAAEAGGEFCRMLEELPKFSGKKVVLVPLGMRSYKQPQQVMLINYLMTLGAEFDYLINLDGYNELVLSATFNVPHQVYPSFPREWDLRVSGVTDVETVRIVGRIAYLRGASQRWAALFDRPYLQSSPLALLIWESAQIKFQAETARQYEAFRDRQSKILDFAAKGPRQHFSNDHELLEHCTEIWLQSSLQLHFIAQGRGIKYYHFLQPNQYVPGSKPMDRDEREIAVDEGHPAKPFVIGGYPLLQAAGRRLAEQQVQFYDLTQVFSQTRAATYTDSCCHLTSKGNRLLAAAITKVIAANR